MLFSRPSDTSRTERERVSKVIYTLLLRTFFLRVISTQFIHIFSFYMY